MLRLAGVPVIRDLELGPSGSYRINREWYFPHIPLSDQECLDLSVLAKTCEGQGLQLLDSVISVRDKILDTLPAKQQDIVRDASALFDVLSTGMVNQAHCSKIMTSIQKALLIGVQIEGKYHTPHGPKTRMLSLQPRRVFLAGGYRSELTKLLCTISEDARHHNLQILYSGPCSKRLFPKWEMGLLNLDVIKKLDQAALLAGLDLLMKQPDTFTIVSVFKRFRSQLPAESDPTYRSA